MDIGAENQLLKKQIEIYEKIMSENGASGLIEENEALKKELEKYKKEENERKEKTKLYYNLDRNARAKMSLTQLRDFEYNVVKKSIHKAKRDYFLQIHREREDKLVLKDRERMWAREESENKLNTEDIDSEAEVTADEGSKQERGFEAIDKLVEAFEVDK